MRHKLYINVQATGKTFRGPLRHVGAAEQIDNYNVFLQNEQGDSIGMVSIKARSDGSLQLDVHGKVAVVKW